MVKQADCKSVVLWLWVFDSPPLHQFYKKEILVDYLIHERK